MKINPQIAMFLNSMNSAALNHGQIGQIVTASQRCKSGFDNVFVIRVSLKPMSNSFAMIQAAKIAMVTAVVLMSAPSIVEIRI